MKFTEKTYTSKEDFVRQELFGKEDAGALLGLMPDRMQERITEVVDAKDGTRPDEYAQRIKELVDMCAFVLFDDFMYRSLIFVEESGVVKYR